MPLKDLNRIFFMINVPYDGVESTRLNPRLLFHSHAPSKGLSTNAMLGHLNVFQPRVNILRANEMQANLNPNNATNSIANASGEMATETNLVSDEVVCVTETGNTPTTECFPCDSHFKCLEYFTYQKQYSHTQNSCVFIILILYLIWVGVIYFVELGIETLIVTSFAWIWTPVLFIQICYHLESHKYIYFGFLAYVLLTVQLYGYLTFQNTSEFDFFVDMYMLTHQTVIHICLRESYAFPVWSFLITSISCGLFRVVTYGQMDIVVTVGVIHNTYLFVLVVLSIIMYSTAPTAKSRTSCKQP